MGTAAAQTFGDFIREKREALGKTIRGFAAEIKIGNSYLNDIEKGNRNPPEKYLEAIANGLGITEEKELNTFYDLAGKFRNGSFSDLNGYIAKKDVARVALRTARDHNIPDRQWQKFIDEIKDGSKVTKKQDGD